MDASAGGLQELASRLINLESSVSEYKKQVVLLSERCASYAADRDATLRQLRAQESQRAKLAAFVATYKPEGEDGSKLLEAINKLL
jgi:hypothetical protein